MEGITIIDDFAHHPTAVEATMKALRTQFPERRIWAIFEAKSNTSRRKVFQNDYPKGLALADRVILSKPFQKNDNLPAHQMLDIEELARSIEALGPPTLLIPEVDDIVDHLAAEAAPGDLIVGLSGSAFGGLHRKVLSALEQRFAR